MSTSHLREVARYVPAVDVKQNASPAIHDEATVPATPARGIENRMPMMVEDKEHSSRTLQFAAYQAPKPTWLSRRSSRHERDSTISAGLAHLTQGLTFGTCLHIRYNIASRSGKTVLTKYKITTSQSVMST